MQPKYINQNISTKNMLPKIRNQKCKPNIPKPNICNKKYANQKYANQKKCNQKYATQKYTTNKYATQNENIFFERGGAHLIQAGAWQCPAA